MLVRGTACRLRASLDALLKRRKGATYSGLVAALEKGSPHERNAVRPRPASYCLRPYSRSLVRSKSRVRGAVRACGGELRAHTHALSLSSQFHNVRGGDARQSAPPPRKRCLFLLNSV